MRVRVGIITALVAVLSVSGIAFAQNRASGTEALLFSLPFMVLGIALAILMIVCQWKIFEKAGQPGWACLIPIYNLIVMFQIAKKPEWWVILCFVPFVNIVISFIMIFAIAEKFGKSGGFAIGMILLPYIFFPVLAFGDSRYTG
jgi:hypothetical protein